MAFNDSLLIYNETAFIENCTLALNDSLLETMSSLCAPTAPSGGWTTVVAKTARKRSSSSMTWWMQLGWTTIFSLMLVVAIGGNTIVIWIVLAGKMESPPGHRVIIGREFRDTLKKPLANSPIIPLPRVVPAFSLQSRQRNTVVEPPPRCYPRKERPPRVSNFHTQYKRGDLPIAIVAGEILWKEQVEGLDYSRYLPIFCEGLRETEKSLRKMAKMGARDMILKGKGKVLPVIPLMVMPLKHALDTRNKEVMINAMKMMQDMVQDDYEVGEALVPYYRQLLPMFNVFRDDNVNSGEKIDNSEPIGDVIERTLNMLERFGGEDAFINIKYMVPTYESCLYN